MQCTASRSADIELECLLLYPSNLLMDCVIWYRSVRLSRYIFPIYKTGPLGIQLTSFYNKPLQNQMLYCYPYKQIIKFYTMSVKENKDQKIFYISKVYLYCIGQVALASEGLMLIF